MNMVCVIEFCECHLSVYVQVYDVVLWFALKDLVCARNCFLISQRAYTKPLPFFMEKVLITL